MQIKLASKVLRKIYIEVSDCIFDAGLFTVTLVASCFSTLTKYRICFCFFGLVKFLSKYFQIPSNLRPLGIFKSVISRNSQHVLHEKRTVWIHSVQAVVVPEKVDSYINVILTQLLKRNKHLTQVQRWMLVGMGERERLQSGHITALQKHSQSDQRVSLVIQNSVNNSVWFF